MEASFGRQCSKLCPDCSPYSSRGMHPSGGIAPNFARISLRTVAKGCILWEAVLQTLPGLLSVQQQRDASYGRHCSKICPACSPYSSRWKHPSGGIAPNFAWIALRTAAEGCILREALLQNLPGLLSCTAADGSILREALLQTLSGLLSVQQQRDASFRRHCSKLCLDCSPYSSRGMHPSGAIAPNFAQIALCTSENT